MRRLTKQEKLAREHGLEPEDFDYLRAILGVEKGMHKRRRNFLVVRPLEGSGADDFAAMMRLQDAQLVFCGEQWEDTPNGFAHIWHATRYGCAAVGVSPVGRLE